MNENTKKGLLIAVIVIAVIGAIYGASSAVSGEKPTVVKRISMPPGFKSEREQDLERLQKEGKTSDSPTAPGAPVAPTGEKDLGGDLR